MRDERSEALTTTESGEPGEVSVVRGGAHRAPAVEPMDRYNRELVEQAHPPEWANPEPAERYDLVVAGGGTAGLVAATGAVALGARVALVERELLGGDCLVHGCVPSKAVLRAARAWHAANRARAFGGPEVSGRGDFAEAMRRMRRLRAEISHHDAARRFAEQGVDVFFGEARFVAGDALRVAGATLRFRRALIATGGRPALPPIDGVDVAGVLTNETIFSLTELPRRLAVIGGGPIGCELAQAFARFGSEVTLVQRGAQLLPKDDADAAEIVQRSLERDGVRVLLDYEATRIEREDGARRLTIEPAGAAKTDGGQAEAGAPAEMLLADQVLVATGRRPNVEGLGLEAAGVDYDDHGVTVTDRLETTNERIFAAGDAIGGYQFTHVADAHARIVLRNALFPFGREKKSELVVPWCTYTSPALAHVGLTAEQADERGIEIATLELPMTRTDRAIVDGDDDGFLRLHLEAGSDTIVGATLVAEGAGDIIATLSLAIHSGVGLSAIAGSIFPYPTQAEILKRAADDHNRRRLTPRRKKWLERYFRWRR